MSSFSFNPSKNINIIDNKRIFLNQFQSNFKLNNLPNNLLSDNNKIIDNKIQINHQNFNHNTNPVNFQSVNINFFQKNSSVDKLQGIKIKNDFTNMNLQTKINPNNLSKTEPFCRINSKTLYPRDNETLGESRGFIIDDSQNIYNQDKYKKKGIFGMELSELNEKSRSKNSIIISKSSNKQMSFGNLNQK